MTNSFCFIITECYVLKLTTRSRDVQHNEFGRRKSLSSRSSSYKSDQKEAKGLNEGLKRRSCCPRCPHLQHTFAVREIKDRFLL